MYAVSSISTLVTCAWSSVAQLGFQSSSSPTTSRCSCAFELLFVHDAIGHRRGERFQLLDALVQRRVFRAFVEPGCFSPLVRSLSWAGLKAAPT